MTLNEPDSSEKITVKNQTTPGRRHPNTTELAGFMKVNDTPAAGR